MSAQFGRWLRGIRANRGWSLRTVERRLKEDHAVLLSDTHLCHIERGNRDALRISPYILRGLILAYELDPADVFQQLGLGAGVARAFGEEET